MRCIIWVCVSHTLIFALPAYYNLLYRREAHGPLCGPFAISYDLAPTVKLQSDGYCEWMSPKEAQFSQIFVERSRLILQWKRRL
jgi:hypothetical protein